MTSKPRLQVQSLTVRAGARTLLDEVNIRVEAGSRVALLGASGSGKSLTASAVLGTLNPALTAEGTILLDGHALPLRGPARTRRGIATVAQDSRAALHPLFTIGAHLRDALQRAGTPRNQSDARSVQLLADLGIEDPEALCSRTPGAVSGGQRQRACLALALAANPHLIVADEPTTALDSLAQADVLAALSAHTGGNGAPALLFITHDVAAAAHLCDHAVVMADGRVVESATMTELVANPQHEFTRDLVSSARGIA